MNRNCLTTLLLSAFCAITAPTIDANADIPTQLNWTLVAVHSSKCLDVPGNSSNENVQIQQWDCNGGDAQRFNLNPIYANGTLQFQIRKASYTIRNLKESGTSNASSVIQTGSTGDSSSWSLVPTSDGKWNFVNVESSKCLDISGSSNGSLAQVYDCTGNTNQQFYLEPDGGHFTITALHSGKCLDVEGSSTANGARIEQNTCNGGWTQQWKILPFSGGTWRIFINRGTNKVIDLYQGIDANGTAIQQYQYVWNVNQLWQVLAQGSPINGQQPYLLRSNTGTEVRGIDIEGASQSAGANAQLWQIPNGGSSATTNQLFTISQ